MKYYHHFFVAVALLIMPACDQNRNGNQSNGVKDAIGARPYEGVRDSAEDVGDAAKEAGNDVKDAINGT